MNKFIILFVLNIPFVLYGFTKTYIYWESKRAGPVGTALRVVFWLLILLILIFANTIYNFLVTHDITNSPPISLADVALATGFNFCVFIIIRLYNRVDKLETKLTQLVTTKALQDKDL